MWVRYYITYSISIEKWNITKANYENIIISMKWGLEFLEPNTEKIEGFYKVDTFGTSLFVPNYNVAWQHKLSNICLDENQPHIEGETISLDSMLHIFALRNTFP